MKAQMIRKAGHYSEMTLEEVPRPEMVPGGVRIAVHAAGLNFADILMCSGEYQDTPDLPFTPGMEVAGEVVEVAPDAEGVFVGDRVVARVDSGGYAEEVMARSGDCWVMPTALDMAQGAGYPIAYGTSHVALTRRAKLQPGEVLLVHGAAGGVGLTAVEIGKAMGATVVATAGSAEKLEIAKSRGADHLINYREENIRDRVRELVGGADVVYDPVGGDVFSQSLRCINPEGRLVVVGFAAGEVQKIPANILLVKNCDVIGFYWGAYAKQNPGVLRQSFAELARMVDDGKLNPHVSHALPLAEAPAALDLLAGRSSTGKVVLKVRD